MSVYYAATNPQWTIVSSIEHVVAKQLQKVQPIFLNFYVRTNIKPMLKSQKNIICIFGSGH